ncbi:hypothetical protein PR003_g6644 [Phytophthora rubi]|uniref:Reverse transcriptase Ty1/copia-type domain-containing protein n=1 Tax=Phytophthora rubi TaxID=129364 RepID=A0A6A4FPS1_9STRA|nr:hypothetical protein PR003_g6644 [Phytophthora rubi]
MSKILEWRTPRRLAAKPIQRGVSPTDTIMEPLNLAEVRRTQQWYEWETVTWTEVRTLEANYTYDLVLLPPRMRALDHTVQLQRKLAADGSIAKYKYRMTVRQGDVPAAYLKAKLKDTVYVKPVKEYEKPGEEDKVWRLKKALYGLKQAGRGWNKEIDRFLEAYGLRPTTWDACLYYIQVGSSLLLVCLYVDDVLIAHRGEEQVLRLLVALNKTHQIKNLGPPSSFLGMKIRHEADTIYLS